MYKYTGAKALVELNEIYLRQFFVTWQQAKEINVSLPVTDDENYKSLETLLFHVLRAARNYMVWICAKLNLPDPAIDMPPGIETINEKYKDYAEHLFEKWKTPLENVEPEQFSSNVYLSNWGVPHTIEAMLEHAVTHPIRHEHQLKKLMEEKGQ